MGANRLVGGGNVDTYIFAEAGDLTLAIWGRTRPTELGCEPPPCRQSGKFSADPLRRDERPRQPAGQWTTSNDAANTLTGGVGNDSLNDGSGHDILDGGRDIDLLAGGMDDVCVMADLVDTIDELATEGADWVDPGVSVTLSAPAVNIVLTRTPALPKAGSSFENTVTGAGGANTHQGLGGMDTLMGGEGHHRLNAGTKVDRLVGGSDDDTDVLAAVGDLMVERPGGGTDLVEASLRTSRSWR